MIHSIQKAAALLAEVRRLTGSKTLRFKVRHHSVGGNLKYGEPHVNILWRCPHVERLDFPHRVCGYVVCVAVGLDRVIDR